MSEVKNRKTIRWQLLATVSAIALIACNAQAADADQPVLWIDLGGQWSHLGDSQEIFTPDVLSSRPGIFSPVQKFQHLPLNSLDEFTSLSFQPETSDWSFSASIRYGRSAYKRHVRQQTNPKAFVAYLSSGFGPQRHTKYPAAAKFADTDTQNSERHLILDFQAGKDVGLGLFSKDGSSRVNLGVRFAQFSSKSNIALKSDPDWQFKYFYLSFLHKSIPLGSNYHSNAASIKAARSFRGLGPTLSWNGSAPLAGNPQSSEITFDWGLNAALLFGRQKAKVHHQSTVQYHNFKYYGSHLRHVVSQASANPERSRSVTVPNIGGMAGISFRYGDAKISFGYRADLFFNAIDGGIDTRKSENRNFYGPFASISVGLGG